MSHRRPVSRNRPPAKDGFALLLTITLLAFIILLLVGLATYTRVETAIAGNMQRQTQARENALFALNVALGRLQAQAGPDRRVTATAAGTSNPYWTGAWKTDSADPDYATPAWLVSGSESATAPDPTVTLSTTDDTNVRLVGNKTVSATSEHVWVKKMPITAPGVPGQAGNATIGRYGWWVGDQGVKAPVALTDGSGAVDFAPYDSADLRARIRQQVSLGAGAADTAGGAVFEPRDTDGTPSNVVLAGNVTISNQLAFLHPAGSSSGTIGFATQQKNFHAWSPNNFAVIANSKDGGLRQDLSLKPDLLGVPFTAWANYTSYMEKLKPDPVDPSASDGSSTTTSDTSTPAATSPTIAPAYGDDPLRRRYVMTPTLRDGSGGSHQIGPVLTYFLLSFSVRTDGTTGVVPLEIHARWMLSLWNPYTSSLVPDTTLQADVTGLPTVTVFDSKDVQVASIPLQSTFGSTATSNILRVNLRWDSSGGAEDRQSWLPGRVYTWRSAENTSKSSPSSEGYSSDFYSQKLDDAGVGVVRPVIGTPVDASELCRLVGGAVGRLRVALYITRADGTRVPLGAFQAPPFGSLQTQPQALGKGEYQFGYVFRLAESFDTPAAPGTWLTSHDLRRGTLSPDFFVVGELGDDPALYINYTKIDSPSRLLDRAADSLTYNEDVPIFELPRGPILSMGALQHFRISLIGARPFMIGNSWGSAAVLNGNSLGALFDRFYFSGVASGVTPTANANGDLVFPNPLLKSLRKSDGTKITVDEFRATATVAPVDTSTGTGGNTDPASPDDTPATPAPPDQTDGRSSKFLLQAGAFNLNSVNVAAWAAVLRSVRFPSPQAFPYLDVSSATGTAADSATATVSSPDAQFFRFSQSAQETFKADDATAPPYTNLFRKGMRTLTAAQVGALAGKIVDRIKAKLAAETNGGPYRSLEEFLAPTSGVDADGNTVAGPSLLEAAIADTDINASVPEFSSQWLTQGDIMTALAPVLYARSDTFVIRTYGEAMNPATNAVEGRAWCEAIVQRLPDYVVTSDPPETLPAAFDAPSNPDDAASSPTQAHQLNKLLGRRFKVVSFRWLTRSDI